MSYLPAGIGPCGCTRYEINPDGGTERSFFLLAAIFFGRSFPAGLSGIPHAGIRGFGPYRPVVTFGPGRVAAVPPEHPASGRSAAVGEALRSWLGTSEDMDYLCAPSERGGCAAAGGFPEKTRSECFIRPRGNPRISAEDRRGYRLSEP